MILDTNKNTTSHKELSYCKISIYSDTFLPVHNAHYQFLSTYFLINKVQITPAA